MSGAASARKATMTLRWPVGRVKLELKLVIGRALVAKRVHDFPRPTPGIGKARTGTSSSAAASAGREQQGQIAEAAP